MTGMSKVGGTPEELATKKLPEPRRWLALLFQAILPCGKNEL